MLVCKGDCDFDDLIQNKTDAEIDNITFKVIPALESTVSIRIKLKNELKLIIYR